MSSRRSRSSRQAASSSRITEQQVRELVSKLQTLLPRQQPLNNDNDTASTSRVLREACNYIRSLHKEVDNLSERLSELLQNTDNDTDLEAVLRRMLM
ncbi:transcription factor ILI6-like [Dendrobium catenatum]|uniref:Transcription factor bHLH135 n=1 Tax=Dendrobium catenatum TaxID=906689 RepID=A0A2I0VIE5_9ASPA|nr:transcription factor ILI6-like [Dendrobium catenatum]PKU63187.1 Transcription factor bHLH135 [Dendrobium catenatum]